MEYDDDGRPFLDHTDRMAEEACLDADMAAGRRAARQAAPSGWDWAGFADDARDAARGK